MDILKSFFGGGKPKGGAIKKQSVADQHLLVILLLTALILWFADKNRYDSSYSFMQQYPAHVFIVAAFAIAFVVYMLNDPNNNGSALPVPVQNAILIIQVLSVCILLAIIANSSFRDWVQYGGEWVQYGIVLIVGFGFISFVFTPRKNKSWTDTFKTLGASGVGGAIIGALALYFTGPELALASVLGGSGAIWTFLRFLGY